ncbi:hypothetical protein B7494_g726 [Chlorociboria aeruginascens]|nr:hypothetical protein B7494_g726 [Chlorociboria aeruginascens]
MAVNTINARNDCGALGPTYVNAVVSMDLADVSTLQPYANSAATTRMGTPQQLTLSDLATDCPKSSDISTNGAINNYHPIDDTFNRCNPRLQIPVQIKRLGYPYWKHCSNDDYVFGIYDPPGAVPPATNLIPTTTPTVVTATYEPPSTVPTAVPDQASSTSASQTTPVVAASTPVNSPPSSASADPVVSAPVTYNPGNSDPSTPANTVNTPTTTVAGIAPGIVPGSSPGTSVGNALTSPANAGTPPANAGTSPANVGTSPGIVGTSPANIGTSPGNSVGTPASSSIVAVVGSSTINVVAASSGIVLPNGSTASVGAVVTLSGGASPVTVSVGSSGVNFGGGGQTTYVPLPTSSSTPVAVAIATIGSNVISAVPSATSVVIGSQTAYLNGAAVTQDGNAVKLTPTGVVVGNLTDGSTNTYNLPTQAAQPVAAMPFATVGGQVISATPGATAVTIGGQAVTSNGSPITLAGSNAVATLGSSGLIIQYSAGIVSSFALPTATPTDVQATVDGIPITAQVGVSTVIIGTQTLTVGGPPITLSGNQVATLGTGGLVIQAPGGVISTVSMSATTSSSQSIGTLNSNSTTSTSESTAAGAGSGTSQTGGSSGATTAPTVKGSSSMGGKIDIRRIFVLITAFITIGPTTII